MRHLCVVAEVAVTEAGYVTGGEDFVLGGIRFNSDLQNVTLIWDASGDVLEIGFDVGEFSVPGGGVCFLEDCGKTV